MTVETLKGRRAGMRRFAFFRGLGAILPAQGTSLVVAAVCAFTVLMLAGPRLAAQMWLLPVHAQIEALQDGTPLGGVALARLHEALSNARDFDPRDARLATDLALVELRQADAVGAAGARPFLEAAIAHLEEGLSLSPANSFAWARLAGARFAIEGAPGDKMRAALSLSYVTGPYADKIMPFRAGLAMAAWDGLDTRLRDAAKRELVYLWERRGEWEENQLPLMALLCRTGRTGLLAQALIEGHRSTVEFDKLYPSYMSPEGCREKWPSTAQK